VPTLTQELNREIIKVGSLENGKYIVSLDGQGIGEYSADALANGINIATLTENPNQKKSIENYNLLAGKKKL